MSQRTPTPTPRARWKPRGVDAWAVTLSSCVVVVATVGLAYSMSHPVRWNNLGRFAAIALAFPLHLLGATFLALLLVTIAVIFRAKLAAWLFGLVMILTVGMALVPTAAVWRQAQRWDVPLSWRMYALNAAHVRPGSPQIKRSVVYGTTKDGTKLQLDVWSTGRPNVGKRRGAVLMIHGGAWMRGTRSATPDWSRWLNDLGYEVFDVEYRMPPPVRPLDEIGDVTSALGWIAAHADEYYIDTKRISVMGRSAGANLAMLAAYSGRDAMLPRSTDDPTVSVRSVINMYGPTDMAPLSHITSSSPATLTLLGTNDRWVSVDHATLLDQALSRANVPHEMFLLPATDHGFDANWGGFGTQIARATIRSFLKRFG